jgi:hypothetical protein
MDDNSYTELKQALRSAQYAALACRAPTDEARALVNAVIERLAEDDNAEKRGRYRSSRVQERRAVEGFLADLLRAHTHKEAKGWVYKSLRSGSFTGREVRFRAFSRVIERLIALGLVEQMGGYLHWAEGFGKRLPHYGHASRFRATPELLTLSEHCGVPLAKAGHRFTADPPANPGTDAIWRSPRSSARSLAA